MDIQQLMAWIHAEMREIEGMIDRQRERAAHGEVSWQQYNKDYSFWCGSWKALEKVVKEVEDKQGA